MKITKQELYELIIKETIEEVFNQKQLNEVRLKLDDPLHRAAKGVFDIISALRVPLKGTLRAWADVKSSIIRFYDGTFFNKLNALLTKRHVFKDMDNWWEIWKLSKTRAGARAQSTIVQDIQNVLDELMSAAAKAVDDLDAAITAGRTRQLNKATGKLEWKTFGESQLRHLKAKKQQVEDLQRNVEQILAQFKMAEFTADDFLDAVSILVKGDAMSAIQKAAYGVTGPVKKTRIKKKTDDVTTSAGNTSGKGGGAVGAGKALVRGAFGGPLGVFNPKWLTVGGLIKGTIGVGVLNVAWNVFVRDYIVDIVGEYAMDKLDVVPVLFSPVGWFIARVATPHVEKFMKEREEDKHCGYLERGEESLDTYFANILLTKFALEISKKAGGGDPEVVAAYNLNVKELKSALDVCDIDMEDILNDLRGSGRRWRREGGIESMVEGSDFDNWYYITQMHNIVNGLGLEKEIDVDKLVKKAEKGQRQAKAVPLAGRGVPKAGTPGALSFFYMKEFGIALFKNEKFKDYSIGGGGDEKNALANFAKILVSFKHDPRSAEHEVPYSLKKHSFTYDQLRQMAKKIDEKLDLPTLFIKMADGIEVDLKRED